MMLQKKKQKEHNSNWPQIPGHPYRILIIGGFGSGRSGSGKTNSLFNLINHQIVIKFIYTLKVQVKQNINF